MPFDDKSFQFQAINAAMRKGTGVDTEKKCKWSFYSLKHYLMIYLDVFTNQAAIV